MRLLLLLIATSSCVVLDSMTATRCFDHVGSDVAFMTPNPDTALQFQIDRCQLDADACAELCTMALLHAGATTPATACHVEFSATQATVHATFDRPTGAPGCIPDAGVVFDADVTVPFFDL